MAKHLNNTGLSYLIQKVLGLLNGKVDKEDGKALSTNDFTDNDKDKLTQLSNYTHPVSPGNKHIPAGGSSGQILKWASDGEAEWQDETVVLPNTNIHVSSTEPADAKDGDLWIDLSSEDIVNGDEVSY